jgi:hypothetical protein
MKHQCKQRIVQTIDLGYEQLQIIEEPDQHIRVLFRGIWLRGDAVQHAPWRDALHFTLALQAVSGMRLAMERKRSPAPWMTAMRDLPGFLRLLVRNRRAV